MVNYGNGKIYKLVNNCDDKVYVGSTCNPLSKRKSGHKEKAKRCPERKVYQHLNSIGWDNVEIILVESYECKTKDELHARERHWVDELKPELNKNNPAPTHEETRQRERLLDRKRYNGARREYCIQKAKEIYENNKESINIRRREKFNCECGGRYTRNVKSRHLHTAKHTTWATSQQG